MYNNYFKRSDQKSHKVFMKKYNERTIMYQSFFGFEKSQTLPPNIILTGPVSKPASDLLSVLE